MGDGGELADIAGETIRDVDGGRGEVAQGNGDGVARAWLAIAADEDAHIVSRQSKMAGEFGLLQQAKAEIGIADRAGHIKKIAALGTMPERCMAVRHEAERSDGDAQRPRGLGRVAAGKRDAAIPLEIAEA